MEVYQHFNGGIYLVLHTATHSETQEEMMVYKALNDDRVWVSPKSMFHESVFHNGMYVPRFKRI